MAKHPTARRVHRTDTDEDVFVSTALETGLWAKHHQRILTTAAVVVVVAVAAFAYLRHFNANAEAKAATELTMLRQEAVQGNQQLAIRDLSAFVKKYGSTPSASEARLLLAQEYLQTGKPGSAVEAIQPAAKNPAKGNGATATLLLGAAYEAGNKPQQAIQEYLRVADKARFGFEKREALDRAAALELARGNSAKAAEYYERALKTIPATDTDTRGIYEMRLAEARAAGVKAGS